MRVLFTLALGLVTAACSGGAEPSTIKVNRSSGTGNDRTESTGSERPGASPGKPSAEDPPPPQDPPPQSAPSSSSTTPPPPPSKTSTCTPPRCIAGGGLCGCKATDATGAHVDLGCQDGQCVCLSDGNVTTQFAGTCDTQDDATALFLANCACK